MQRHRLFAALVAASLLPALSAGTVHAAAPAHDMSGMEGMDDVASSDASPSTLAYQQAMVRMHQNMKQSLSGNPDVDYVRQMIPHHQAAVEMAEIQLAYGKDEGLKDFSRWIITAQKQEIGYMTNWLRGHDQGATRPCARDYYGTAMEKMHHGMMIAYTGDADVDFVRGMIAHHQGAVDMSAILFPVSINPEIRTLAEGVYRSQNYEIAWQRHWLRHPNASHSFPSFIL